MSDTITKDDDRVTAPVDGRTCHHCGKSVKPYFNYCDFDCHIAAA